MLGKTKRTVILTSLVISVLVSIAPAGANTVPEEWVTKIENHLGQLDVDTTAEIVVYVAQSLRGHGIKDSEGHEIADIVNLGVYIFNELPLDTPSGQVVGIGKTGQDNGVLVIVAMAEREWRIEVGYGLEGDITDIEANNIAQQYLIPKFREEKYGEGLYDTVVALSQQVPIPDQVPSSSIRGRYFYENLNPPVGAELPFWAVVLLVSLGIVAIIVVIVISYLVKKGRIKVQRTTYGSRGGRSGGFGTGGGGGSGRGGGGRSGGGGAGGKW